ncbi:MAG: rhomboid family intramembrane serine protease [Opitutaceae bacterium]|nr:rhomboid family intramembrane serine protease [Cytophagales bacterium]
MRLSYNAPVVLSLTFLALGIFVITHTIAPFLQGWFITYPIFNLVNPIDYFRLFSHILGHQNIEHFVGNFTFILLLGPILEEKYGSQRLLVFILTTAFITGVLNAVFFNTGLLGASGIVFLFILLASFTTFKSGEIPLTFIFVFVIFIGQEVYSALGNDNVSQFAHILGGMIGSVFGFKVNKT